jgi:hypothetical protein
MSTGATPKAIGMTRYRMNTACTRCPAVIRVAGNVVAASTTTVSSVHCPLCGARLSLDATCGVQELSVHVMAYEVRSTRRSGHDRRAGGRDRRRSQRRAG